MSFYHNGFYFEGGGSKMIYTYKPYRKWLTKILDFLRTPGGLFIASTDKLVTVCRCQ
jgi:hypothetical protein